MIRMLSTTVAALCVAGGALLVPAPVTAGATTAVATTTVATPTAVKVTPGVGAVTVSWGAVEGADETFTVTSSPAGTGCSVIDESSCTIVDTSSKPYAFTVVASEPGATSSAPSAPTAPLAPHLVLVVAGQSNANGYESYAVDPWTGIDYMAAPYTNGADSHDLLTWLPWSVLQGDGATPAPLDSPQQVVISGQTFTIFGPEIGLARQIWADTGRAVTIVKDAYPGTSLAVNWDPKRKGTAPDGLFDTMVANVKATMAADAAAGQFDVLGGFYWYQGETDVTKLGWAAKYQSRLEAFIEDLRADLPMSPTAPVALAKQDLTGYTAYLYSTGALNARWDEKFLEGNTEVRAADDWAVANMPDVVEVDTYGMARVAPLDIHLSNVSQLALGEELAKATEKLFP